jgi:hypothetical protein
MSMALAPKEPHMSQTICFALPIVPGATDADRDEMLACWRGDRADGHRDSRTRHGITREATWIQSTPAGDVAIVLLESDDLAASLFGVATSTDPFDTWFRAHVQAVHGIDLAAGMNLPEQVLEYSA